jgi:hypothetical protein
MLRDVKLEDPGYKSQIRNFSGKSRRSGNSRGNAFLSKISIPSFSLSILKLEEKDNHVIQIVICFTAYNRRKEKQYVITKKNNWIGLL